MKILPDHEERVVKPCNVTESRLNHGNAGVTMGKTISQFVGGAAMETNQGKGARANIHDVAREAGTSPATVSRVINNTGYPVSAELRQKILQAAEKLEYTPNALGRMLKKNESRDIGVIIPTIANPFYPQIVLGIEMEAKRRGYGVFLCNTFREEAEENRYIKTLFQKQVLGIALSSVTERHDLIRDLQRKGLKVVFIDQEASDVDAGKIGFNYIKGGHLVADHLVRMGHSNVAYLTSPLARRSRREQLEGFRMGLARHGLEIPQCNVLVDGFEEESEQEVYEFECGSRLAGRLLELADRPTAVFTANDMIAIGAIRELLRRGVRVPDDISVVGFDNILLSSITNPPLTTIDQPSLETGRFVCRMLIGMIEGTETGNLTVSLEPTLVERGSVKALGR